MTDIITIPPEDARTDLETHLRRSISWDECVEAMNAGERDWYQKRKLTGRWPYSLYNREDYLLELLYVYKRTARPMIQRLMQAGFIPDQWKPRTIMDWGAGLGFALASFAKLYPKADCYYYNLPGKQTDFAVHMREIEGVPFSICTDESILPKQVDMIFYTEVAEHFIDPFAEVRRLIERFSPKWLICTWSFTIDSRGHFPEYKDGGEVVPRRSVARRYTKLLGQMGYTRLDYRFWNGWPKVYIRG